MEKSTGRDQENDGTAVREGAAGSSRRLGYGFTLPSCFYMAFAHGKIAPVLRVSLWKPDPKFLDGIP
jgi:hypothetical protein